MRAITILRQVETMIITTFSMHINNNRDSEYVFHFEWRRNWYDGGFGVKLELMQ